LEFQIGDLVVYDGRTLKLLGIIVDIDYSSTQILNPWNFQGVTAKIFVCGIGWGYEKRSRRSRPKPANFKHGLGRVDVVPITMLRQLKEKEKFDD
jgi:hypothetical protein